MHDDYREQENDLIDARIAQENQQVAEKTASIAQTRLEVVKSQGAPRWTNTPPDKINSKPGILIPYI